MNVLENIQRENLESKVVQMIIDLNKWGFFCVVFFRSFYVPKGAEPASD
jgi:hypothetical protein